MKVKNIIIGAGPAGIQMADLLQDEEYLILEKADVPCSFFHKFPRHRKFISLNKGRELRYDWNSFLGGHLSFRDYSEEMYPHVDDYLRYVNDFVKLRDIKIQYNFEVKSLEKREDLFYINGDEYIAERVFFGIGLVHKPIIVSMDYDYIQKFTYENMPLDKEVYRDKNIIVVGGGNAAFETVKWLEPFTNKIFVFSSCEKKGWQTHYPGHLRSVNFQSIDSYYLKAKLRIGWDCNAACLYRFINERGGDMDIVIFCHGFKFKSDLVKNLVEVATFPVLTPHFESTKCKNLFFIGSNSQQHDYKKGTSAFIHGFRYNCDYISRYVKGQIVPKIITTKPKLIHNIMHDINVSSCLFHRFDYFCILIGFSELGYEYINEIPLSSIHDYIKPNWEKYITIHLGYNKLNPIQDTFHQEITGGLPNKVENNKFLHAIINTSSGETFRMAEHEYNEFYLENAHFVPLKLYLDVIEGTKTKKEVFEYIDNSVKMGPGRKMVEFLIPP